MGEYTIYAAKLRISAVCEACQHEYDHYQNIEQKVIGWGHERAVGSEVLLCEMIERTAQERLGWKRCPKCGYVQSWMKKSYLSSWRNSGAGIGFMLGTALLIALSYWLQLRGVKPGPVPAALMVAGVLGFTVEGALVGKLVGRLRLREKEESANHPMAIPPKRLEFVKR